MTTTADDVGAQAGPRHPAGPGAVPDPGKIVEMALRVWGYKQGEVVSLMIHLGDRLGIYRALDGAGPVTAEDLAARTGLQPRWLPERLRGQAAAGLLETADGQVFQLAPEAAALLADEEGSVWFAAGAFQGAAATEQTVNRLAESFRTGGGLSFDDFGPDAAAKVERTLGPWSRLALVPQILPALDGVTLCRARIPRMLLTCCSKLSRAHRVCVNL